MSKEKSIGLGNLEYLILNYSAKDQIFWLKVFEHVEPKFFEKESNRKVFLFFKSYFKKYNSLPKYDVAINEIDDVSAETIEAIYQEPAEDTKEYIYDKTIDFVKTNLMYNALNKSIELLKSKEFNEIDAEIKKVILFNLDTSLGVSLTNVDERYAKINNLITDRVSTGSSILDNILEGGWAPKELYSCASPPGIGKSIFLANWAVAAVEKGYNVLVYTLEISEERLSMRHDAIFSKIPTKELLYMTKDLKKKYAMHQQAYKSNLWIKEFPTKSASVYKLKSHYEMLQLYKGFIPDVIFIDYAGLMQPTVRTGDTYNELRVIFEDLRGWAGEANVPIITAAQTNRKSLEEKGGTKEIITQAQVSDSLGITQTLDLFMTITQSKPEKEQGLINLYIDKHRNGQSSQLIKYSIDYKNFLLDELV